MPQFEFSLNHLVAFLGLVLAVSVNIMLRKFGYPEKIIWGASILSILVVAIFWSTIMLGANDEED
jgi:hypothetical protein